mmetsp:Transcript_34515/g.61250  ORF Transcript_34515/g.61250 Transcript_34515/m.61250 type:complete len:335 (-) Transcript_34515:49-1053(-)
MRCYQVTGSMACWLWSATCVCILLIADGALPRSTPRARISVDPHQQPHCSREYTCDAKRGAYGGRRPKNRVAVYTYNFGGYEAPRATHVPCAPTEVDAFLFLDEIGWSRFGEVELNAWLSNGWKILNVSLIPGTKEVSAPRITAKSLKFTPPSWLLNGTWDWLVGFDGNIVLDLHKLSLFTEQQRNRALVLLDWSYHMNCTDDSFRCFEKEVTSMMTQRQQYIATSRENVVRWKELLEKLHQGTATTAGRQYRPPNYYEANVILRNLKHKKSGSVRDAFQKTFLKCYEIQRDQFLLPFFLWQDNLDQDTEAMPLSSLSAELGYCTVGGHLGRNF